MHCVNSANAIRFKEAVEAGHVTKMLENGGTYHTVAEHYRVSVSTVSRRCGKRRTSNRRRGQKAPVIYFSPTPAQRLALCSAW